MRFFSTLFCTLLVMAALMPQAMAAPKSFAVLPFKVSAPEGLTYLEQAVPPMVSSRLYMKGQFEPQGEAPAKVAFPANQQAAKTALQSLKTDFVVWGTITVNGEQATVEMFTLDSEGKQWRKQGKSAVSALMGTLQNMTDSISSEVFKRQGKGGKQSAQATQMNPGFVVNETNTRQVYLNPQFRYQGADGSRMRSQRLNFASVAMEVADVNGDGKNEIVLVDEDIVRVFTWGEERMTQLGEYALPKVNTAVSLRTYDFDKDKAAEIIVSTVRKDYTEAHSYILSFKNNTFSELAGRIPFFMNVVKLAPDFRTTLIGQRSDDAKIFSTTGVYELIKIGKDFTPGAKVELPNEANVYNFSWLPGNSKNDGDKLVVVTKNEQLAVYTNKGSRLYLSEEKFSGSAIGLENQVQMPGMGRNDRVIPRQYYIPLRMIAVDLEQRGEYSLLVSKPISVSAQYFDRYRFFPEGEVHSLFWDGVGLNLLWKTRRIKGSVIDFTIADLTGDGTKSLVVCLNTHPGNLGIGGQKTMIVAYPLDLTQTDPNTAPAPDMQ